MLSGMFSNVRRENADRIRHNNFVYGGQGRSPNIGITLFSGNLFGLSFSMNTDVNSLSNLGRDIINKDRITENKNNVNMDEIRKRFDFKLCRLLYKDYEGMSDEEIMKHYAEYGHKEERVIYFECPWFDVKIYKYLNDDLMSMSDDEALKHFIECGYNENRASCLPKDFDECVYKSLYEDLRDLSNLDAKYHYAQYGRKENRKYKRVLEKRSEMKQNEFLIHGEAIFSNNNKYMLVHQQDGNVVLYEGNKALWNSNTAGKKTSHLIFQNDGNLVIYNDRIVVWASGSENKGGKIFVLQNDSNIVIYRDDNKPIWARFGM